MGFLHREQVSSSRHKLGRPRRYFAKIWYSCGARWKPRAGARGTCMTAPGDEPWHARRRARSGVSALARSWLVAWLSMISLISDWF